MTPPSPGDERPPIRQGLELTLHRLGTPQGPLLGPWSLQIPPGQVHSLMGPSGSGKSSLLAALCGTLPDGLAFEGEIRLDGRRIENLPPQARRIGILFQDDLLFPHMTVRENLLFALPAGSGDREAQVLQALEEVEMAPWRQADPARLSGGQRVRVALVRALLAQPAALLLDEPFARLDAGLRQRMRALVFDRIRQRNIPALLVTHDEADVPDPDRCTRLAP